MTHSINSQTPISFSLSRSLLSFSPSSHSLSLSHSLPPSSHSLPPSLIHLILSPSLITHTHTKEAEENTNQLSVQLKEFATKGVV